MNTMRRAFTIAVVVLRCAGHWAPVRGDMPAFVRNIIPFYRERLLVPPGITGWAQISYPYAASISAARRKLQYDLYYIKHMSLFLDITILLRTFKTILVGLRHSEDDEEAETYPDRKDQSGLTVLPGGATGSPDPRAPDEVSRRQNV